MFEQIETLVGKRADLKRKIEEYQKVADRIPITQARFRAELKKVDESLAALEAQMKSGTTNLPAKK